MEYAAWWSTASTPSEFAERLEREWTDEYRGLFAVHPDDIVVVDPGNGFQYTFDLAGSLDGANTDREPRVVGVWGRATRGVERDRLRMRGHPKSGRPGDDRGHLIACAAGGGYDINLVPMDAALNRGRSTEGARFRALERRAASVPGSLYFVRLVYEDSTARPAAFDVGVAIDGSLTVEAFENGPGDALGRPAAAVRSAAPLALDGELVAACLDTTVAADRIFFQAWRDGCGSLTASERATVAGVTGHVAESVVEVLLAKLGWSSLWHFTGPGRHGVDLIVLSPDNRVVVIEVKGTLVPRRVPRLTRREVEQMSAAWVDKRDNPGMAELGLQSEDVLGAVVAVNFRDRIWRGALTRDFASFRPIVELGQLEDLSWLDV